MERLLFFSLLTVDFKGFFLFFVCFLGVAFSSATFAFCFDKAGEYYDINPELLEAIAYTESRLNPDAINDKNSNGTVDYGLMQINSTWFVRLEHLGVSRLDVINDSCVNVFVGAWVLAQNFKSHGKNWKSVGAYNAGFSSSRDTVRRKYIEIVKSNLEAIRER